MAAKKKAVKKKAVRKKAVRKKASHSKNDDKKLFAFLATFLTIFGFLIAYIFRKDDKYVMHYAKEGLALFFAAIIVSLVGWLPVLGYFLEHVLWILWVVLWVMSWINAVSGEVRNTWLLGEFVAKLKL